MRFIYTLAAALLAAVVTAQSTNNAISIPEGQSTLEVTAGQPLVIDWTNPSDGTVTIKLVQVPITPDSGIVLVSGIPASVGSATLQIPPADEVNSFQYTIEIIDDTNPDNYNFSPNFGIQGATGTATGSASTASATGSTASGSSTRTSSGTSSNTTESSSATSTDSSSSSEATTTRSSSSSSRSSSATSSGSASQTTSAPSSNTNAASDLKVQGGLLAMAAGIVVAVM